jgi:excisionase family DNA binding protein
MSIVANSPNTPKLDAQAILDVNDAARLFNVSPSTIRHWVSIRRIPHYKLGSSRTALIRFKKTDLVKWLEEYAVSSR